MHCSIAYLEITKWLCVTRNSLCFLCNRYISFSKITFQSLLTTFETLSLCERTLSRLHQLERFLPIFKVLTVIPATDLLSHLRDYCCSLFSLFSFLLIAVTIFLAIRSKCFYLLVKLSFSVLKL